MTQKQLLTIELLHEIEQNNTVELTDFFDILETVGDLVVMRRVLAQAKDCIERGYTTFLCHALEDGQRYGTEDEKALSKALIEKIASVLGQSCGTLVGWIDENKEYEAIHEWKIRIEYRLAWLRWMDKQLDLLEVQYRDTQIRPYGG